MAKPRFSKHQIIYQASWRFSKVKVKGGGKFYDDEKLIGVVIERQVDSCGLKKITFFSRDTKQQNDSVFGKSYHANAENLFASADDAMKFLKDKVDIYCPQVYSDDSGKVFEDYDKGVMELVEVGS